MVIANSFRCLGFIDAQGVWRNAIDGTPIEEDVFDWQLFD
jgi:hypothetical protein